MEVQIGYPRRFDPAFVAARAAVVDGDLGVVHTVRSTTLDPAPPPWAHEWLTACRWPARLARAIASSRNQAHAPAGLGRCAMAAGHATRAGALLRRALEIFQRIGAAEADDVAHELTALTEAGPVRP